MIVFVSVLCQ